MFITNHVLSGALVGLAADSAGRAVTWGAVSHIALDAVPHFGVQSAHLMRAAVPDGLLGLATIGVIAAKTPPEQRRRVLAGIFGACLPDMDKPGRQFVGRSPFPRWFDRFHGSIQTESVALLPTEVATAAICGVALARRLRRR